MSNFVAMEIHSQNDHPGDEILDNQEQFLLRLKSQPLNVSMRKQRIKSYLYIFICPFFLFDDEPLSSLPNSTAPFCMESLYHKTWPAYLIFKGKVHLGVQILRTHHEVDVLLRLAIRTPRCANQSFRYEMAQVLLFDNSGSFKPLDIKTIIIHHDFNALVVLNTGEAIRPPLVMPLPYFQSPMPQEIVNPREPAVSPSLITVGNSDFLYIGTCGSLPIHHTSVLNDFLTFLPQISHTAKIYLTPLLQPTPKYWFSPEYNNVNHLYCN